MIEIIRRTKVAGLGREYIASTVDDDFCLDSCSERDFDNHGCNKTRFFLVTISGSSRKREL